MSFPDEEILDHVQHFTNCLEECNNYKLEKKNQSKTAIKIEQIEQKLDVYEKLNQDNLQLIKTLKAHLDNERKASSELRKKLSSRTSYFNSFY